MRTDVLIVGFGPVGKLLALRLANAGHRVVVAEKQVTDYPLPRAVTHDSEFARILQAVGLAPSQIPDITEPYDDMYRWFNSEDETLLEVDWSGIGESGWYNTYFFHQPAVEVRLEEKLSGHCNVTILRGWEYAGHEQGGSSVTAVLESDNDRRYCLARYLIGADGAGSRVRGDAGIPWHDLGYFFDWLVVDVRIKSECHYPHVARQLCDHARPCTMVPGGPGRRRWEFMMLPGERPSDVNQAEFAWTLLAAHGVSPANAELERHAHYRFQAGWAKQWRHCRVLIAGDAAHLMPPFAGQGLGAGLRDVMNLSWKLGAVLAGLADDSILDTYGAERIPHVAEFVRFSISLGEIICVTDAAAAVDRDRRMIAEYVNGAEAPVPPRPRLGAGVHVGPFGGLLSIQAEVEDRSHRRRRLDDVFDGPGILLVNAPHLVSELSAKDYGALRALGIPVCLLCDAHTDDLPSGLEAVVDIDGRYRSWLSSLDGAGAVLIRPDFYLYGTAHSAEGVAVLAHSLCGRIAGQPAGAGSVS